MWFVRLMLVWLVFLGGVSFAVDDPSPGASVRPSAGASNPIEWDCGLLGSAETQGALSPEELTCNVVKLLNTVGVLNFVDEISFIALLVMFVARTLVISLGPNPGSRLPGFLWSSLAAALLFLGMSDIRSFMGDFFASMYRISANVTDSVLGETFDLMLNTILDITDPGELTSTAALYEAALTEVNACTAMYLNSGFGHGRMDSITISLPHSGGVSEAVVNRNQADIEHYCWLIVSPQLFDYDKILQHFGVSGSSLGLQSVASVSLAAASAGGAPAAGASVTKRLLDGTVRNVGTLARGIFRIVDVILMPVMTMMNMVKFGSGIVYLISVIVLPIGAVLIVAGQGVSFFENWGKVVVGSVLTLIIMPIMWSVLMQLAVLSPVMMVINHFAEFGRVIADFSWSDLGSSFGAIGMQVIETIGMVPMIIINFLLGILTSIGLVAYLQNVIIKFLGGVFASAGKLAPMTGALFQRNQAKISSEKLGQRVKDVDAKVDSVLIAVGGAPAPSRHPGSAGGSGGGRSRSGKGAP